MWPLMKGTVYWIVLAVSNKMLKDIFGGGVSGKCSVAVNERNCVLDCFEEQVGFFCLLRNFESTFCNM